MLLAEEIAKQTDKARSESSVDRRFNDIVESLKQRADMMQGTMVIKKLTKYGLGHPAEVQWLLQYGTPMPEEAKAQFSKQELEQTLVDGLYADQQAVNDRLVNEGFDLTEKPLDLPSVLDPNLTQEARDHIEALKKLVECEVEISWEHLTVVKKEG